MAAKLRPAFVLACLTCCGSAFAQILTYTENTNSDTELAVGYPIPIPVDSLTSVSGFRLYTSLHAQHQDLMFNNAEVTGQVVGTTRIGRDIWAYVVGDADNTNVNGTTEAAMVINGGIHAREWASPEVVTELLEQLVEMKADNHIGQYIIENMNTVILPVNNVDGFLQTQAFPAQVTPTPAGEPTTTEPPQFESPRDGRMRRKNMLNVDEDLSTAADRLFGVDLNRNNEQFFENGRNSPDPASIVYRGTAPASEPEILALRQAVALAPLDRMRLYIDSHSFSRVFFVPSPPNPRQNANTAILANKLAASTGTDPNHPAYFPVIGQTGSGISGTAEFYAYVHNVPAWTLEIEPPRGFPGVPDAGAYYGGFGVSHDGFILPDSEIARARDELTVAHILALYHQAGPPSAQSVRIADSSDSVFYEAEWQNNGDGTRTMSVITDRPLIADGTQYQLWLAFDKPMRFTAAGNSVIDYPGQTAIGAQPVATITGTDNQSQQFQLTATFASTAWPQGPGGPPFGYRRYRTDAITGTFTIPNTLQVNSGTSATLDVIITDMAGLLNDADPSTVVDFENGGWTGYEDGNGIAGDTGGVDRSFRLTINPMPSAAPPPPSGGGGGGGGSVSLLIVIALSGLVLLRRHRVPSRRCPGRRV